MLVVHDRGPRAPERESAPGAFGAATHGPGAWSPATRTDGASDPDERVATRLAERPSRSRAYGAALREEKVHHRVSVGGYSLWDCEKMRSASCSVSAEPMSYHSPGSRHVYTAVRG